jgi:ABC-2 type transport system permease protein
LLSALVLIATAWLALVGARDAVGLTLFAAVVLGYGAFWIALNALINLFVRASTTAALVSGTARLGIVVLLPAALAAGAEFAAPRPSAMAYTNAVREVRAANADAARLAATANSGRAYPATLWQRRGEIEERDARLGPIHRAHAEHRATHRALADGLHFLSPAVIAQDALNRIAATDASRALAFQDQARAFASKVRMLAND